MFCVVYSPFLLERFESTSLFLQNKSKLERFDIICHGGLDQKKIILSNESYRAIEAYSAYNSM